MALSIIIKKREKTKKSLSVSWKMGSSCLVLSFFHVFIESFSSMNHLFVPFTVFYIWGKQLALILMQFCCSKSKGNPKKKLMKLKAFWFIALSFPRISRRNVKEIGGFSRAQSLKVWLLDSMHQNQGVRERGHEFKWQMPKPHCRHTQSASLTAGPKNPRFYNLHVCSIFLVLD